MQPEQQMQMQLRVPPHLRAGQELEFMMPTGEVMKVRIPVGVNPGDDFVVSVAAPPMGAPVPMGLPVDGAPSAPPVARGLSSRAKYAECPICFEPLHAGPVGVFLDRQGKRVSNHFFRLEAAQDWIASGGTTCPLTRQPIASVKAVPDVGRDPDGWFAVCDINGDGKLSRKEAIECLKAQYAVDVAQLDAAVADESHWMWQQWDSNHSGTLERHELLQQPHGLVASVRTLFPPPGSHGPIPEMRTDKSAWYDFFDEDRSGSLEQEEVVRALIKTLGLSTDQPRVREMRSTVQAIWAIFDDDGSGSIERNEFLKPGEGLADTILATLGQQ